MADRYPITFLSFFALGVVAYVGVSHFMSAPAPVSVAAAPAQAVATPNPPTAAPIVTAAPVATAEPIAAAQPLVTAEPIATAEPAPTPNHGPRHVGPVPSIATIPVALPAEPQPAAQSAPTFFSVDTTLYARGNTRLRVAPSTTADVVTKLAAGAPLHAVARSTDGAWWQVSLAGGHTGYVNRAAVSKTRIAQAKPPAAVPAPVAAAAPPLPVPARDSQGVRGYVDEAMNWFTDTAARGKAPEAKRAER